MPAASSPELLIAVPSSTSRKTTARPVRPYECAASVLPCRRGSSSADLCAAAASLQRRRSFTNVVHLAKGALMIRNLTLIVMGAAGAGRLQPKSRNHRRERTARSDGGRTGQRRAGRASAGDRRVARPIAARTTAWSGSTGWPAARAPISMATATTADPRSRRRHRSRRADKPASRRELTAEGGYVLKGEASASNVIADAARQGQRRPATSKPQSSEEAPGAISRGPFEFRLARPVSAWRTTPPSAAGSSDFRHILDMGREAPLVAERIGQRSHPIAPELVLDRHASRFRPRRSPCWNALSTSST